MSLTLSHFVPWDCPRVPSHGGGLRTPRGWDWTTERRGTATACTRSAAPSGSHAHDLKLRNRGVGGYHRCPRALPHHSATLADGASGSKLLAAALLPDTGNPVGRGGSTVSGRAGGRPSESAPLSPEKSPDGAWYGGFQLLASFQREGQGDAERSPVGGGTPPPAQVWWP